MFQTKNLFIVLALALGSALTAFSGTANVQNPEIVAYRLTNWKTFHFDDAKQAEAHVKTVKRLGCEVKTGDHGGHIDVSYRCSEWREISLDSHGKAHTWEKWLKASGFETRHTH